MTTVLLRWLLPALACTMFAVPLSAADAPRVLKWADLVPVDATAKPRGFLFGAKRATPADEPPASQDQKFMSMKSQQPGDGQPPRVVQELDGKTVTIGGYIVPLDFESTDVKEFLLVPFVGACIHVPPPPANQIVYVKASKAFKIKGEFDPVSVTGTIRTTPAFTGLADAGYSLDADKIELFQAK